MNRNHKKSIFLAAATIISASIAWALRPGDVIYIIPAGLCLLVFLYFIGKLFLKLKFVPLKPDAAAAKAAVKAADEASKTAKAADEVKRDADAAEAAIKALVTANAATRTAASNASKAAAKAVEAARKAEATAKSAAEKAVKARGKTLEIESAKYIDSKYNEHDDISILTYRRLRLRHEQVEKVYEETRTLLEGAFGLLYKNEEHPKVAYSLAVTDLFVEKALAYLEHHAAPYRRWGHFNFLASAFQKNVTH